jgi:hypothetical protein
MTTKTPSLEVPKHKEALLDSYKEKEVKEEALTPENFQESALDQLPNPTGYRILVLMHAGARKTKGGIHLNRKYTRDNTDDICVWLRIKNGRSLL